MDITLIFLIASACLCVALAVFADPLFDGSNEMTRKLGFHRLADFRNRVRKPLVPVARIVLVLTAILIIVLTLRLTR